MKNATWYIYDDCDGFSRRDRFQHDDHWSVGIMRLCLGYDEAQQRQYDQLQPGSVYGWWAGEYGIDYCLQQRVVGRYVDCLYGTIPQHRSLAHNSILVS